MTNNRLARQKRIEIIAQVIGYPAGGYGILKTIDLWNTGEHPLAIITAFASLGLIIIAILAKFCADTIHTEDTAIENFIRF